MIRSKIVLIFLSTLVIKTFAQKENINVNILIHNEVEVLDFTGPAEVFEIATYFNDNYKFNVNTIAKNNDVIISQKFLKIIPNYSFSEAKKTDVLVLPGGNTELPLADEKTMNWIMKASNEMQYGLTFCTGVFLMEKIGKLKGLKATSHAMVISGLDDLIGEENVIRTHKYVDNGEIITSAGVSSGIEGALQMIYRIAGYETAMRTARYIEYPYWKPSNGFKNYNSGDLLKKIEAKVVLESNEISFGELDMLGHEALYNGDIQTAVKAFELNKKLFPNSVLTYNSLKKVFERQGKWVPKTDEEFLSITKAKTIDQAYEMYLKTKKMYPDWKLFMKENILIRGEKLFNSGNFNGALKIFEMTNNEYPGDLKVQLLLCKTLLENNKIEKAISLLKNLKDKFQSDINIKKIIKEYKLSNHL